MSRVLCETWDPSSPSGTQAMASGPSSVQLHCFHRPKGEGGTPGSLSRSSAETAQSLSVDDQSPATNSTRERCRPPVDTNSSAHAATIAELCSAGQTGGACPTWFVLDSGNSSVTLSA